MTENSTDRLRKTLDERRREILTELETIAEMSHGDQEAMRQTYGRGMEKGSVVFKPDTKGRGTLRALTENEKGQKTWQTREITDPNEANLLAGLQGEADQKRGK